MRENQDEDEDERMRGAADQECPSSKELPRWRLCSLNGSVGRAFTTGSCVNGGAGGVKERPAAQYLPVEIEATFFGSDSTQTVGGFWR